MTVIELKQYIYDNNKIEFILNEIGCGYIKYHSQKEYYSCANVDGDNKSAVTIKNVPYLSCRNYTREKYFDDNSDLLSLVKYNLSRENKDISFYDVMKYTHKKLGLKLTYRKEEKKKEKIDPLHIFKRVRARRKKFNVLAYDFLQEGEALAFNPYIHISWYKEGIMPWTSKKFGLAYNYTYKRNVIPLRYWLTGELMGFTQRTVIENYDLFDIKKYFITPGYPKQMNLFGLWENREHIKNSKHVVVFEAEKSVLKRDSLNDFYNVAISGHEISDEQAEILIGLDCEIVIAFDKDIDIEHIRHCCEKFYYIRKVSYIYDKWDLMSGKESPADKNNIIYQFMFEHRVTYDENEHREYLKSLKKGN